MSDENLDCNTQSYKTRAVGVKTTNGHKKAVPGNVTIFYDLHLPQLTLTMSVKHMANNIVRAIHDDIGQS